jgi:hypothetical protein
VHVFKVIHPFVDQPFQVSEDVLYRTRNDTQSFLVAQETVNVSIKTQSTDSVLTPGIVFPVLTEHCVSLARASLSVCENCGIKTQHHVRNAF